MKAKFDGRAVSTTLLTLLLGTLAAGPANADGFVVGYSTHYLVSDGSVPADHTDANLVNAWGIAFNPFGPVWIADNGTGLSTLYDGAGNIVPLVVTIPLPQGSEDANAAPTGIVYNGSSLIRPTDFVVSNGATSGNALFMFATEQGTIAGWAPAVDFTNAFTVVDSSQSGAIYKGLALGAGGSGSLLYATDFHNRKVDVFDASFQPVAVNGGFKDPIIPANFAPFGIQAINGDVYVTFAQQDADKVDDVHGRGLGYVDAFDANGNLLQRVAIRGFLNAPWGIALAPVGFGAFGGRLLVGNFGDGHINAFDLSSGRWVGMLSGADRRPLTIDGLWGLAFGNGFLDQRPDSLYFTAGPDDEAHGAYGTISMTKGKGKDKGED
jgi:uncharacterized protein (TIGR03118 family)